MMMDLFLYAVPVADDIDTNKKDKWIELINDWSAWFIWDYFKKLDNTVMIRDDQMLTIPKEAWESFIDILDRNRERISSYSLLQQATDSLSPPKESLQKILSFQEWYIDVFNTIPFFGYLSAAEIMLKWLDADSEVRKYLDDPSYTIILEARY